MSAEILTKILDELRGLRDDIKSLEQTMWEINAPDSYKPPRYQSDSGPQPKPKKMTNW